MNQILTIQQSKLIISELESTAAAAELFIKSYYSTRKKLESVYSPASPSRGKSKLNEQYVAHVLAKRLKRMNKV